MIYCFILPKAFNWAKVEISDCRGRRHIETQFDGDYDNLSLWNLDTKN